MKNTQISPRITPRDYKSFEAYLREINKIPIPSIEEEVALAQRIHQGDESAADRLVTGHLRFVVSVAKQFMNKGVDLCDLVSAGNIGMMKAAWKYDETQGIKFCSYAVWHVKQKIYEALNNEGHMVRLPANKRAFLLKLAKERSRLEQELQHTPSLSEVADRMGEDELHLGQLLGTSERPVSLDEPLQSDEEMTRMDLLADPSGYRTDDSLMRESLHDEIENVLSELPPSERMILEMSYGFSQPHPYTIGEIAIQLKLSNERVRQLHSKAIRHIQNNPNIDVLRAFL